MPKRAPIFMHRERKAWENQGAGADKRLRGRKAVEQRKRRLLAEPLCRRCKANGIKRPSTVPDHILPLSKGGSDDDANIQCLCEPCHEAKTRKDAGYREKPQIGRDGWPVQ